MAYVSAHGGRLGSGRRLGGGTASTQLKGFCTLKDGEALKSFKVVDETNWKDKGPRTGLTRTTHYSSGQKLARFSPQKRT